MVCHPQTATPEWLRAPEFSLTERGYGQTLVCPWLKPERRWVPIAVLLIANFLVPWLGGWWPFGSTTTIAVWVGANLIALFVVLRVVLNSTEITRSRGEVVVKRGPFPWHRRIVLLEDEVEAIQLKRRFVGDTSMGRGSSASAVYHVLLIRRHSRPVWLLKRRSWVSAVRVRNTVRDFLEVQQPQEV